MMLSSEPKYNLKIQKIQNLMVMITLKFQSLNLHYEGELEEIHSQLTNRYIYVVLLLLLLLPQLC